MHFAVSSAAVPWWWVAAHLCQEQAFAGGLTTLSVAHHLVGHVGLKKSGLMGKRPELETDLNVKLELQNERVLHLEQDYEQVLGHYIAVQEKQLEERLGSSQTCSKSAAESDRPKRSLPS